MNQTNCFSKKLKRELRQVFIIYCCGESLEQRELGNEKTIIREQIEVLRTLSTEELNKISIAYEPIWAIGTGVTASPSQAEEMHAFIRGVLSDLFSESISNHISILYGGSCNENNAEELFSCQNIDGGLIGGASLKQNAFYKLLSSPNESFRISIYNNSFKAMDRNINCLFIEIDFHGFYEEDGILKAFISNTDFDELIFNSLLGSLEGEDVEISYEKLEIENRNWNASWEANFDPVEIAQQLYIRAPFAEQKKISIPPL